MSRQRQTQKASSGGPSAENTNQIKLIELEVEIEAPRYAVEMLGHYKTCQSKYSPQSALGFAGTFTYDMNFRFHRTGPVPLLRRDEDEDNSLVVNVPWHYAEPMRHLLYRTRASFVAATQIDWRFFAETCQLTEAAMVKVRQSIWSQVLFLDTLTDRAIDELTVADVQPNKNMRIPALDLFLFQSYYGHWDKLTDEEIAKVDEPLKIGP